MYSYLHTSDEKGQGQNNNIQADLQLHYLIKTPVVTDGSDWLAWQGFIGNSILWVKKNYLFYFTRKKNYVYERNEKEFWQKNFFLKFSFGERKCTLHPL